MTDVIGYEPPGPDRLSRRTRTALAVIACLAAVAFIVVEMTGSDSREAGAGGPSSKTSAPTARAPSLPAGARPLPGNDIRERVGVLSFERPTVATISRQAAIAVYAKTPGPARDHDLMTALVRLAYVADGHPRRGVFWVVSDWYHPAAAGLSRQWCVYHLLVDSATARPAGRFGGCLSPGSGPVAIH